MSKPRPDLDCSTIAAKSYVEWLASTGLVESIHIAGSRNPKSRKTPRDDSDWDLIAVTNVKKLTIPKPREQFGFHADVTICPVENFDRYPKVTEIYPTDKDQCLI